jgi:F-box domain
VRAFVGEMTDPFISSFESLPFDAYRRTISTSMRALLAEATIPARQQDDPQGSDKKGLLDGSRGLSFSIHRYDSDVLTDSLLHQIPWQELCTDHDHRMLRQRQQEQFECDKRKSLASSVERECETTRELEESFDAVLTTPLHIVLDVVEEDQAAFPRACTESLTRALLVLLVFMDEEAYGRSGTNDPADSLSCGSTNVDASSHDCRRRPSHEALLCTLLRCCKRIPSLSLQGLLLELLQKRAQSTAAEPSLNSTIFKRISSLRQLHRIWYLITKAVEPSSSIGSASKACNLPPKQDSRRCLHQLRIHLQLLLVTDDVAALHRNQGLASTNIDSDEQEDPRQLDRPGPKRRARLPLTGQQQVMLWHGEIDPSIALDSDDEEEARGDLVLSSDVDSAVRNKVRRFHQHHHKSTGTLHVTSNGYDVPAGQDWHRKKMTSMRTKVLSQILSCVKSLSSGHGMQVLNTLLIPALDAKPWSTSVRLLNVLLVAAIDRLANPIRLSSSTTFSSSLSSSSSSGMQPQLPKRRASNLHALQHLLNEVWDRVLSYLACNDERDNNIFKGTSRGSGTDQCSTRSGIGLLHFYAELLGECAWFDDAVILACALEPLLKAIVTDGAPDDASDEPDCAATHASLTPSPYFDTATQQSRQLPDPPRSGVTCAIPFRCALAFILSRRGTSAVLDAFSRLGTKLKGGSDAWTSLALRFCHWSDWYHEAWHEDRVRIRLALQAAGILSVCDDAATPRSNRNDPSRCRGGMRSYVSSCCRQAKALHVFVFDTNQPLFSRGSVDSGMIGTPTSDRTRPEPTLSSDQHMSGDIIRHVFGFLGYKRLVRMRAVSQEWKMLADDVSLWRRLYCARFGTPQGIVDTGPGQNDELDWKSLFERKLAAERPLRFRRHSSGWKVRTCRFVGCLHVLTTPGLASRHEKVHLKSLPGGSQRRRRVVSRVSESNKRSRRQASA